MDNAPQVLIEDKKNIRGGMLITLKQKKILEVEG